MFMRLKDKINIKIEGNEKNRSEIIYNNLLEQLDTKDAKIEYLKDRLTHVENDNRNRIAGTFTILLGTIILSISYVFMIMKWYFVGVSIGFIGFFGVVWKLSKLFKETLNVYKSDKFEELEQLYESLDQKLK